MQRPIYSADEEQTLMTRLWSHTPLFVRPFNPDDYTERDAPDED